MGTTSTFCGTPEVTITCCLVQKLSCLSFLIFRSSCLIQKLSCIGRVSFRETVCALFICNLDIFPLISWGNIVTISERTVTLNVTISERTVLHQIHCDVADKNNGVSFDDLDIHYHWYDSPSYRTCCHTSDNILPDLHNCYYFIFVVLNDIM